MRLKFDPFDFDKSGKFKVTRQLLLNIKYNVEYKILVAARHFFQSKKTQGIANKVKDY